MSSCEVTLTDIFQYVDTDNSTRWDQNKNKIENVHLACLQIKQWLGLKLPFKRVNLWWHVCSTMKLFWVKDPMQWVSITTDVVSSNLDQGEVYNIMW